VIGSDICQEAFLCRKPKNNKKNAAPERFRGGVQQAGWIRNTQAAFFRAVSTAMTSLK
jgi:hypothetical protein